MSWLKLCQILRPNVANPGKCRDIPLGMAVAVPLGIGVTMKSLCLPMIRLMVALCALALAACGGRSDLDEAFRMPDGGRGGGGSGGAGPGGNAGVGPGGMAGSVMPFCGDGNCDPGEQG